MGLLGGGTPPEPAMSGIRWKPMIYESKNARRQRCPSLRSWRPPILTKSVESQSRPFHSRGCP
eukprot:8501759-Lingulodinium_polyedra.AAC.1